MKTTIHEQIEEWMAGALLGALDAEEQSQFEQHLAECAECRALYREEQRMNTILEEQLKQEQPDPNFDDRMVRNFRKRTERRSGAGLWRRIAEQCVSRPWQTGFALLLVTSVLLTGGSLLLPRFANVQPVGPEMQQRMLAEAAQPVTAPAAPAPAPSPTSEDDLAKQSDKLADNERSAGKAESMEPPPPPTGAALMNAPAAAALDAASADGSGGGAPATLNLAPAQVQQAQAQAQPSASPDIDRKLIRNANVSYEVADFTKASDRIGALVNASQGYVATQNSDKGDNGKIEGQIVVKVPPPALDNFLLQLRALGDLKSQTVGTQDVTKDYYDTDARMRNAQAEEDQLLDILKNHTGRLSDVLEVEREVARVRGQIEQMQGTLKYYDTMVQYATVTIALAEKDLNQAAQYLLKQQDDLSIYATNVEATLAKAKDEAAAVNAQTLDSQVQRDSDGKTQATLSLLIDPAKADAAIAQFKALGRIQNFQSHTQRVAQDGSEPSLTAKTDQDKVALNLTIQQDEETSVQQTDIGVAAGGVEEKVAELKKTAVAAGADLKGASFQRDPSGAETGEVDLRTTLKNYPQVLAAIQALGKVTSLSVNRQETAAANDSAPADITVHLSEPGAIVTPENGLWATLRQTLTEGFGGVMWSVRTIGVTMAFLAPWFLLAGVGIWGIRKLVRRRK